MRVEAIDVVALARQDLDRWQELATRAVAPNPFFEPGYVLPLARALGQEAVVRLLVVRDGDEWRACLPVFHAARWRRIPLRSLATWRGYYLHSPLGTPLVSRERPDEALSLLLDGMRRSERGTRFAALELVADDRGLREPLAAALEGIAPAPVVFDRFERAAFRRPSEATPFEERLSSSRRQALRRQRRKLNAALGTEAHVVSCAGEEAAVDRLIGLENSGWKREQGTAVGAHPEHAAFFKEMCRGFAAQGRLQIFELRGGDRTVASKLNLLGGDTIFLLKEAYDESYAPSSPGTQLELEMLGRFYDAPNATFIDSCANRDNAVFNRLLPDQRPMVTLALPAPGLSGRAARQIIVAAKVLRDRQRERRHREAERAAAATGAARGG